jgi:hypothetical protein
MKVENWPAYIDKFRLFPRAFIVAYIIMFWETGNWFMALEDPNTAQAGFVSIVVGAGAAWFGLYVNSGRPNAKVEVSTTTTGSRAEYEYKEPAAEEEFNPYTR